ncbi:MAG: glycosyl transferase [Enterovirga sp.]|nr:glycosyl transferase [Enterovirga sp.]
MTDSSAPALPTGGRDRDRVAADRPDKAGRRPLLLCFSHLRWDFVRQRPQHLLARATRSFRVVYLEEPVFRRNATPHLAMSDTPDGVRVAVPVLARRRAADQIAAQRDLLDGLLAEEDAPCRVFWYYTPMALPFSGHRTADLCVYDNMDELSAFRGASRAMLANEAALLARADLVFTGGLSLYEAKRDRHPRVHAFPSSIETAHFAAARTRSGAPPPDQKPIPHPRIGFFGVIDERMDLDLVASVAEARPDWHLVMVGPVAKIDPDTLPDRPNIHWLGPKDYGELPAYLAGWDAGLMPFALNESTRFISPTKTPEYLAAGIPVVSTPIADVIRPYGHAGLVEIAANPDEVVRKLEEVLGRPKGPWLARVDRQLATTSWDRTWAAMQALMAERLAGAAPEAAAIHGQPAGPATTPSAA